MWQDGATPRRAALHVEGVGGIPMPQVGVWVSSLTEIFANISSEKGIGAGGEF